MTLQEIYDMYGKKVVETGKELVLNSPNTALFDVSLVRFQRSSHVKAYFKVVEKSNGKTQYFCPDMWGEKWEVTDVR